MRRTTATMTAGLAAILLTLTAACSSTTTSSPTSAGATSTSDSHRKVIHITFEGGKVTPIAEQVDVNIGDQVVLDITADVAGEIHVHSTPEQHIDYPVGHSQEPLAALEIPGQIEVESHALEKTILTLVVH
jgi:hypothetical protein